jgi:hypothetical protein
MPLDARPSAPYPIGMSRVRRPGAIALLGLLVLGFGLGAGSAFAAGACCAEMPAMQGTPEPAAPCHSMAPTSCCEASAALAVPRPSGAPHLAVGVQPGAPALAAAPWTPPGADQPVRARAALATTVLRL